MKVKVYAKLNLTLNVLGERNGFHIIDSVVASVDIFDVVSVVPRNDTMITVAGLQQVPTEQNAAYKAARAFIERFDGFVSNSQADVNRLSGVDIVIEKGIPIGAGMGGSSADIAAVIYALCSICNVDVDSPQIHSLCAELGSDVNYMLRGGLARLRGKGDNVEYSKLGSVIYFALTTFDTAMSTANVYSQFDKLQAEQTFTNNIALIETLSHKFVQGVTKCFNNHLQCAASSLSNYADAYLQYCDKNGLVANMTGSGSVYYVAFCNEQSAINAVNLLNANGFATVLCRTVHKGIELI